MIIGESYDAFAVLTLFFTCFFGGYFLLCIFMKRFFNIDLDRA
jgi:hypothetical protein